LNRFIEIKFQFGLWVYGFPGVVFKHVPKSQKQWFGPYRIQYFLPNNIVLLVTINKFDTNLVFVNINKLKPHMFIEDIILQPILTNLSDLVVDEHVQIKELEPLLVENANFEPIKFELVNNYSTYGNITGTNVPIHYYDNVLVELNYILVCNDQNDTFNEKPIDIYILEVWNLKNCIHFQPQSCYHLKWYKELSPSLSYLFVLVFF